MSCRSIARMIAGIVMHLPLCGGMAKFIISIKSLQNSFEDTGRYGNHFLHWPVGVGEEGGSDDKLTSVVSDISIDRDKINEEVLFIHDISLTG